MIINFGDAKKVLARYAGKAGSCRDDSPVDLFVKSVIQELLNRGANGNVRKWQFYTQNGTITLPQDLLLPIKVRVDGECGGQPGNVYDKFYEFYEEASLADGVPWEKGAVEEPNTFFTQYDLPPQGARVLAVPRCKEDCNAHFMIYGTDVEFKDVWMPKASGGKGKGEYLSIIYEHSKFTAATFTSFTSIEKTVTKDYVRLCWYIPDTDQKGLLADFRPNETRPSFRRAKILGIDCDKVSKVTVLGRVRFYDNYADSDIIPITSLRALKLMAQTLQAEDNDNIQVASYKGQRVTDVIDNENKYNRAPQASVNFEPETSPGSIKNII